MDEMTQPAVAGPVETVRPLMLWSVRVERAGYVLAETQEQAEELAREIERWEEPEVTVSSGSDDLGWPDDYYVYHQGRENITLAQARRDFPATMPRWMLEWDDHA